MGKNKFTNQLLDNQKFNKRAISKAIHSDKLFKSNKINEEMNNYNKKSKKNSKKAVMMMAVAAGQQSTEGFEPKFVRGITSCNILGVCPNKAELSKIYNCTIDTEPVYVDEVDRNGIKVKRVRIDIIIKSNSGIVDANGQSLDKIQKHSYFITNEHRWDKTHTKFQVIDEYGRDGWATEEEYASHSTMFTKKDGSKYQANISPNYRPAFNGEVALTQFIIAFLNIPSVTKYDENTNKYYMVDNPKDSECRFDHIVDFFNGNFSEIKETFSYQPNNNVKVIFGVRTDNEGKLRQTTYPTVLKNSSTNYDKLAEDIKKANKRIVASGYPEVAYLVDGKLTELREYVPAATNFATPTTSVTDPWSTQIQW